MRKLLAIVHAIALFALLWGGSVRANTGVAFVHGTGQQTDALNDYWTTDMVNSVRQGLSDQANYLVVNCDFEQFMGKSAAAGCPAGHALSRCRSRRAANRHWRRIVRPG